MSFKIGDRVRRIGANVPGYCSIGDEGEVIDLDPNDPMGYVVVVNYDNGSLAFRNLEQYLELVVSPSHKRTFNAGDRVVRIIDRSDGLIPVGEEGNVIEYRYQSSGHLQGIKILFDNAGERIVDCDTIKLAKSTSTSSEPVNEEAPKTLNNSQPVQAAFCKKKYYGIKNCDCGNCPIDPVMRFN